MKTPFLMLLFALMTLATSCGTNESTTNDVPDRSIEDVLRDHSDRLMDLDGVVSVGQALCGGDPCIRIGVRAATDSLRRQLPDSLEGYRVDVIETGTVSPLDRP